MNCIALLNENTRLVDDPIHRRLYVASAWLREDRCRQGGNSRAKRKLPQASKPRGKDSIKRVQPVTGGYMIT